MKKKSDNYKHANSNRNILVLSFFGVFWKLKNPENHKWNLSLL